MIELEVLSVGSVPEPVSDPTGSEDSRDTSLRFDLSFPKEESAEDRRDAQAEVRVIETIKGACPVQKFTVVGGPYASCAPHAAYVKFEKGTRFFLILAEPLKAETRTVVLGRRGCLWGGSASEMRALIAKGGASWARMRDRYRVADSAAFARAIGLREVGREGSVEKLEQEPYAVLACLRQLLADPTTHSEQVSVCSAAAVGNGATQSDTVVASRARSSVLDQALEKRREKRPDEAFVFNRVMVSRLLIDGLLVPAELVARLLPETLSTQKSRDSLTECDSPFTFFFWSAESDDPDAKVLKSINLLLALASDEPDQLVHQSFALGFKDFASSPFEPGLFAPYLAAHVRSVALDDWGRLQLLLLLPHPVVVPIVSDALMKERNAGRMDSYARFFVWMDDASGFRAVVDRFLDLAAAELAGTRDRETDDPGWYLGYTARKIVALCKRSDGEWGAARERINAFARRFPEKE